MWDLTRFDQISNNAFFFRHNMILDEHSLPITAVTVTDKKEVI